jgi:NTP pyrophosphatase (non-canonical NTP hydrolase)
MSLAETRLEAGRIAGPEVVKLTTNTGLNRYQHYGIFVDSRVKPLGTFTLDLLHAAVGTSGEAGELLDAVKKHWVYNKPLDRTNVIEELGDLEFYMAAMRLVLGVSRDQVLQANVDKLCKRYPAGYTDAAAAARADKAVETAV